MLIYPQGQFTIPKEFQDGLVAAYNGQHNGDTVIDISGNGNNGTQNGGVTFSRYNGGNMMSFDGSDDYIYANPPIDGLDTYSVFIVINPVKDGYTQILELGRDGDNYDPEFLLGQNDDGDITVEYYSGGDYQVQYTYSNTILGKKYYIAYTQTSSSYTISFFGNIYSSGDISTSGFNSTKVSIGYDGRDGGDYFQGDIYLVLIYNNALSQKQIKKMYDYFRQFYY